MTKQLQASKNLKLSAKVAEYIARNPDKMRGLEGKRSFVVFSADDLNLNKENTALAKKLKQEGKSVVRVEETKNKKSPWRFIPLPA